MRSILPAAVLLAALAQYVAAEPRPAFDVYAKPGQLIDIGGRRINLRCSGSGRTTILLESGLGFPSYSWRLVQPELARTTRTCSYDRAGLGFSDPGPLPRSASRIVDDLHAALRRAHIPPPYLFVANSMGSQPSRLFAFRYRKEVAGLVLVDPYVEGQNPILARLEKAPAAAYAEEQAHDRACDTDLAARKLTVKEAEARECIDGPVPGMSAATSGIVQAQRISPAMAQAAASERDSFSTLSEAELRAAMRPLGAMPIIVLTAGDNFKGSPHEAQLLAELRRLHATLAALSTRGEERLVPSATHVIQASAPDVVIAAAREVLRATDPSPRRANVRPMKDR